MAKGNFFTDQDSFETITVNGREYVKAERYEKAVEALELLWLGDWSAVSGADTSSEYAGEILRNLGEDGSGDGNL